VKDKVSVLAVANQHIIEDLKDLCQLQIVAELSTATACFLFAQADLHEARYLMDACVAFVAEHHMDIPEDELDDILPTRAFRTALLGLLEGKDTG